MSKVASPSLISYTANALGTDWIAGDIYGEFDLLLKGLKRVNFDPQTDRLFVTGNLTGASPFLQSRANNLQALQWLQKPWFHAVRGGQEQLVLAALADTEVYSTAHRVLQDNGFDQLLSLSADQQFQWKTTYERLPWLIKVQAADGEVLISPNQLWFKGEAINQPWIEQQLFYRKYSMLMQWLLTRDWDEHTAIIRPGVVSKVYCGRVVTDQPEQGCHVALNGGFGLQPCIRLTELHSPIVHCLQYHSGN